jgi:uncharacterized GH25 family protein
MAFFAFPAFAHDYWVVPAELIVPGDRDVAISLFVGDDFVAEEEKRFERSRFLRLSHLHARTTEDLMDLAVDGALPMLRLPLRGSGGHLLLVDRNVSHVELEPQKFEEYLRHEGLMGVLDQRARLGESGRPGRERYSRYLKALVQVGSARDETFGVTARQTLELVPESNPVFVDPGDALTVRVLFQDKPLSNARVEAFSRNGADVRGAIYTTDPTGRVRILMDRRGVWLIRMVHMVRCEDCSDANWESFWASYTFASTDPSGTTVVAPLMLGSEPKNLSPSGGARPIVVAIAGTVAIGAGLYFVRRRRQRRPSSRG